jgi:hypothetical protein
MGVYYIFISVFIIIGGKMSFNYTIPEPLSGKLFQDMVLGSGLKMVHVYKKAGVSSASIHRWVNRTGDITLGTYERLIAAFSELRRQHNAD